ncbi:MAG TPA: PIN domain-containing protein [Steroidobacteraceae bacterium]|nr:PIN domain-containing protein [Steroidobacteraceae bacterium]
MKALLDTSVLVAAFYGEHPRHGPSAALLAHQRPATGCTAAHCLAETYSVVTRMPGRLRAGPNHALQFIGSVRERLALVTLSDREYVDVLDQAVSAGVTGGAVYDAIIARCGQKARVLAIYTWNTRQFRLLGADVAARVREPDA